MVRTVALIWQSAIAVGVLTVPATIMALHPQAQSRQTSDITATISAGSRAAPRLAVLDFIAQPADAETVAVARMIRQVLVDDLTFEREFALMLSDSDATIPAPGSFDDVPLDRWRGLKADGVLIGTVQKRAADLHVEVRLVQVRTKISTFVKSYDGSAASPRRYAHTISDDLHMNQRGLRGVARTKLTFDSDRDGERAINAVEKDGVKEVYFGDYDGANQQRVTVYRSLNINPTWSPDGRSIAYTSYRREVPRIFISNIYQGTLEDLTNNAGSSYLPAWSPDGTQLCFASTRDGGQPELYVVNRDGSNVRRLTNHPASDLAPTWSPSGTQIAFVSDRTGTPQIYTIGADGQGMRQVTHEAYADRPSWSPGPNREIAYAARTGRGNDIKVIELGTGRVRRLTLGEGTNESPSWAPNGRHLAFTSTRSGNTQVFVMSRTGENVKQITYTGNNYQPDWSKD